MPHKGWQGSKIGRKKCQVLFEWSINTKILLKTSAYAIEAAMFPRNNSLAQLCVSCWRCKNPAKLETPTAAEHTTVKKFLRIGWYSIIAKVYTREIMQPEIYVYLSMQRIMSKYWDYIITKTLWNNRQPL